MSSREKALSFLRKNPVGVLSTSSPEGEPWGSAIYFAVDDNFTCYFVTRAGTRKYGNLEANPKAALTVTDAHSQTTVQVGGLVEKIPVQEYVDNILDKLEALGRDSDRGWTPPIDKIHKGNYMPLRLVPSSIQYTDFRDAKPDVEGTPTEKIM